MRDLNTFSISGRLTADVVAKEVGDNKKVANFTLAINKEGKDAGSAFIPMIAWGNPANYLAGYAKKGTAIIAKGHIDMTKKNEKDGVTYYPHPQLIVEDVKILATPKGSQDNDENSTEESVELDSNTDLPY